jgi:predicted butyrate kinase (DUF1464 family)
MPRVAGCDPGTSNLDVLILHDGTVADQARFDPADLSADPELPVRWLRDRRPLDLIAGPSGYGLPCVPANRCSERDIDLMALVRPDERGRARGVGGFTAVVRAISLSRLPVVFLSGVIHLPTVPPHRKVNRIDLGTADKLCVAALALRDLQSFLLVEIGSAFTAAVVVVDGQVIDGVGGTAGPPGLRSGGAWDGEAAYLLSPLAKADLFAGGVADSAAIDPDRRGFWEGLRKLVGGLRAVHGELPLVVSGRGADEPWVADRLANELGPLRRIGGLPGAWVKAAAQGAATIADGLVGGRFAALVERLRLREASGSVLDWLAYPRAGEVRQAP